MRAFDNDDVVHVEDSVEPVRDLEVIQVCVWVGRGEGEYEERKGGSLPEVLLSAVPPS